MINMAFMPLYMWEMWDVTPMTHGRTNEQWKVVQYSVWAESAINMSKTCHQIAIIAHIWAQLVIKISKIRHIWFKLAIKLAQYDLYEHFFLIWRPVPLYEITIKSYSYFLSCLKTSVFLTSTEKEKFPWASSSEISWGKFFYTSISWPIMVVKCYSRFLGVL